MTRPKVVLCMIVRNEAHVIRRCLRSVRPYIDSFCVGDTGSTDGTQEMIRLALRDLPGEVFDAPWIDFSHNRNKVLKRAKNWGQYGLVIDADDELYSVEYLKDVPYGTKLLPEKDPADVYAFQVQDSGTVYWRSHLLRLGAGFQYRGVLHEYLQDPPGTKNGRLRSVVYVRHTDGARSQDPLKFRKDAQVLREEVAKHPSDSRSVFYLAQSLKDAGDLEAAIDWYDKRAEMGGWDEEVFFAMHEGARLCGILRQPVGKVIDKYLYAYEFRPTRAETLCNLAQYCREVLNRPAIAYPFARTASDIVMPDDTLFVDASVYEWRAEFELAITSWYAGQRHESFEVHKRLLKREGVSESIKKRVLENMAFFKSAEYDPYP